MDRLGNVRTFYALGLRKIGDRARHAQHGVVRPRRERELGDCFLEEPFGRFVAATSWKRAGNCAWRAAALA